MSDNLHSNHDHGIVAVQSSQVSMNDRVFLAVCCVRGDGYWVEGGIGYDDWHHGDVLADVQ